MKFFKYSALDLTNSALNSSISDSNFDHALLNEWKILIKIPGLFKFELDSPLPTKILSGKFKYVVQKNPKRFSEKRPSQIQISSSINVPFDVNKFNFNKINSNEIIFKLNRQDENQVLNDDYIIINNSPIELGHSLLVPQLHSNLNQVLNLDSIKLAVELIILSNSLNLIIGFNTVQAYSSVNHLHLHIYYLNLMNNDDSEFPFPIQNITQAERIESNLWFLSDELIPIPAFSLQLCDFQNDICKFSKKIFSITDYFIKNEIPHNLVLVKSTSFTNTTSTDLLTVRAVIWPKKPASEIPSNEMAINFAMCELSGHVFLSNDEDFDRINENYMVNIAQEAKLSEKQIKKIGDNLKNMFF